MLAICPPIQHLSAGDLWATALFAGAVGGVSGVAVLAAGMRWGWQVRDWWVGRR